MAYKDSDQIANDSNYALGDYSFRIERTSVPGSTNDKIEAICTKGGKNARKSIQVPSSTQMDGWYVEANETEASVYITTQYDELVPIAINSSPLGGGEYPDIWGGYYSYAVEFTTGHGLLTYYVNSNQQYIGIYASTEPDAVVTQIQVQTGSPLHIWPLSNSFFYAEKTVYYTMTIEDNLRRNAFPISQSSLEQYNANEIAWEMMYGSGSQSETMLVGRFAIELEDAGGVGPGSDWVDPGDYDPDEDPVDPDPGEDLYVTLDKSDGKAGETFVASITGHRQESMTLTVQDHEGTVKATYQVPAPAARDDTATVTILTDISWLPGNDYSSGYIVEAQTHSTGRTASDSFYLEKDWLDVDVSPWDGKPGDVLTATVSGHNGTNVSGIIKNSADETVMIISPITPQDADTAVAISITLNSDWFNDEDTFCESLLLTVTSADGQEAEAGFSMYIDPEELDPEEDLFLELDEYYGEPGDTFTASITGHRQEAMTLTVTNSEGTTVATYNISAPSDKADVAAQAIQTANSWMPDGVYNAGFTAVVETSVTGRKVSAGFTLSVDEPEILYVQVYPYEGMPGETLTATVEGHNGTSVSAVIKNANGDTIYTFSPVTPADAQTEVEFIINLDRSWFSQEDCYCEAFMIIVTSGDGQEASDGFSMIIDEYYEPPTKTLYLNVTGASSGSHQSGSYPSPNSKIAGYGCGGDGGHGGGGGAGASTVVVYRFATDKANNKEITATAQQPGTGSGGGAGSKGGDGIILIYY